MSVLPENGEFSFQKSVTILFVVLGFFVISVILYLSFSIESEAKLDEISSELISSNQNLSSQINSYLGSVKNEILYFKNSEFNSKVFKSLEEEGSYKFQRNVYSQAEHIGFQVEQFIKEHPNMTLQDLEQSREFQKLAVQKIDESSYSAIFDSEDLVIHFHPDEYFYHKSFNSLSEELPELHNLVLRSQNESLFGGYYNFFIDGESKDKYAAFNTVATKTADGHKLVVAATTYLNRNNELLNFSDKNKKFIQEYVNNDLHDVFFIDNDGYLVYSYLNPEAAGTNVYWNYGYASLLLENYLQVKDSLNTEFFGPFYMTMPEHKHLVYSLISPNFVGDEIVGYTGILMDIDKINSYIENYPFEAEISLINNKHLLIFSNHFPEESFMLQNVDNDNSDKCFYSNDADNYFIFKDFDRELELGAHEEIDALQWCLLFETDYEEYQEEVKNLVYKYVVIFLLLIIALIFTSFSVVKYVHSKKFRVFIKKKFPNYKNVCINIDQLKLSKRSVFYSLAFFIFYTLLNYYIIGSLSQKIYEFTLYAFIIYLPNVFILLYSFNTSCNVRKYLVFASLTFIIYALMNFTAHYVKYVSGADQCFYCLLSTALAFVSLILYLLGLNEVVKDES